MTAQLQPHQQRVVDEHAECLDRAERKLLMRQEDVMTDLAMVLAERIAAFMPAAAAVDFPLGKACDLSGDTACEACQ